MVTVIDSRRPGHGPTPQKWYSLYRKNDETLGYRIVERVHESRTGYQRVEILETATFGRTLFLDGNLQSTEVDEFVYHEAIVQPAMCLLETPRTVFIAGGGEGAVLREVVKHPMVESIWMVDIDEVLVDIARRHLEPWHRGAFDDPRVKLIHDDARAVLASAAECFDVVIVDVTAPIVGGPSLSLYTRDFYRIVKQKMAPGGVLVTQAQATNVNNLDFYCSAYRTLSDTFNSVTPYSAFMASDGDNWGFMLASEVTRDLHTLDVDGILRRRDVGDLRLYDSETHRRMFLLPKYVRRRLLDGGHLSTDEDPFSYPSLV